MPALPLHLRGEPVLEIVGLVTIEENPGAGLDRVGQPHSAAGEVLDRSHRERACRRRGRGSIRLCQLDHGTCSSGAGNRRRQGGRSHECSATAKEIAPAADAGWLPLHGIGPFHAAERRPHSSWLASRAPSASDLSFAHVMVGCTRCANGLCAKPQSVPPMRFSRPTIRASRTRRCATNSGCSTMLVAWLMTPGISTLPGGSLAFCQTTHSCSWRGFAASKL